MKHTYLKHFFLLSITIPMLHFANEATSPSIDKETPRCQVSKEPKSNKMQESTANSYWSPSWYYPLAIHYLTSMSASGDELISEDGSLWTISRYDAYKTFSWQVQHPLIITQNHRWFSKYNYRIINQTTGQAVETNLYLGPYTEFTNYVTGIDRFYGYVFLNNGSHFRISALDLYELSAWNVGDAIIIGSNSGYDSSCPYLLINTTHDDVRAEQI